MHRALGKAGGAGGIDDEASRIGADTFRQPNVRRTLDRLAQHRQIAAPAVEQHEPRFAAKSPACFPRDIDRVLAGEHAAHFGMVQHVTRFLHAEFGIDRHHDRADTRQREK
ncbi:hypothetical protein D3C83_64460 [compost metagenome]